jgi:hypothetical protein
MWRNYKVYRRVIFSSIFLAFDNVVEENAFAFSFSILLSFIFRDYLQHFLPNTSSVFSRQFERKFYEYVQNNMPNSVHDCHGKLAFNKKKTLFTSKLGSDLRKKLIEC